MTFTNNKSLERNSTDGQFQPELLPLYPGQPQFAFLKEHLSQRANLNAQQAQHEEIQINILAKIENAKDI